MSGQLGLLERYAKWLPITDRTPKLSLHEGSTPLVRAERLAQWVGVGAVSAAVLIGGSRLMLGEPAGAPPPSASVAATASAPRSPTPPLPRRSPLANPAATVPAAGPPVLSEAARPGAPDRVAEAAPQLSPAEIKQLRETQLQQELLVLLELAAGLADLVLGLLQEILELRLARLVFVNPGLELGDLGGAS